jgi:Rps23 Pro-64 3,4-dihydroxylase Tpa1-like proline 4-hydroxylase
MVERQGHCMLEFFESPSQPSALASTYSENQPFPHIVLDNFVRNDVIGAAEAAFPPPTDTIWYRYNNPLEKKHAFHEVDKLPDPLRTLIRQLSSEEFCSWLSDVTGIERLIADRSYHGGGIHQTCRGGKLDIHLDYNRHPALDLERRVNLILFLNRDWNEDWGGKLEFWNADVRHCVARIAPVFNRLVIFNTSDVSYHGHPDALDCPEDVSRKSIALYYFTPTHVDHETRLRVKFVPRPDDPTDPELIRLRELRSNPDTAGKVYRLEEKPDGPRE